MPRKPRMFGPGVVYHVYCRVSRGERPFGERSEANAFLQILSEVKHEHGLSILGWCLMPSHYHMAVRTSEIPLWRSMRLVQGRYAVRANRRRRILGPVWQSRYQSRVVAGGEYLRRLVLYIHLNPVVAGLCAGPGSHPWSGHHELVGSRPATLLDVDEALVAFGSTRSTARQAYRTLVGESVGSEWLRSCVGALPWWRPEAGDELQLEAGRVRVDAQGMTNLPTRPQRGIDDVVSAVCNVVAVGRTELASRRKGAAIVRGRELVLVVGVTRYGLKVKDLAAQVGVHPSTASRLLTSASAQAREDRELARQVESVDRALREPVTGSGHSAA